MQIKDIRANPLADGTIMFQIIVQKVGFNTVQELLSKIGTNYGEWELDISKVRKKRTLDANAALWKMLTMMAEKLNTTKDELYLEVLDRYGVFTHIVVKPNMVDRIKNEWKTIRVLGEVNINGKSGIQLQCFFGSSTYDSKEFSILLDGVIEEGKLIGVDFISRKDRERMLNEWGK